MKLSKKLQFAMAFAQTSRASKIEPMSLALLMQSIERAANAQVRYRLAVTEKSADKAIAKVEELALTHGLITSWPGLYPDFATITGDVVRIL